jgi:hypothetical protein
VREKTSNQVIKIDYTDEDVKYKIVSKLDELVSISVDHLLQSRKNHLTKYADFIMPTAKNRQLELEDFRTIKQKKSKIITKELDKHRVTAWTP